MARETPWLVGGVILLILIVAVYLWQAAKAPERVVNLLVWSGYEEPQLLRPFEEKYGVKVNYKTFVGGDSMFSLLTQSKGQYDVVTVDPEFIQKLHRLGRLSELDPKAYDLSQYFKQFQKFPLSWIDGKMYSIVVQWGANGLVYNTDHISAEEATDYSILFVPRVKRRVGVWDWYLPIMGVLSRSLGNDKPFDISDSEFAHLRGRLMELSPQMAAIHGTFPEMLAALASGDTWIVPGGAGWIASTLQGEGKPYDWSVPKQGGVMWVDTLVIPTDAPHPDTAKLYIQWMISAEAQALLAQKKAFHANVPNAKAYNLMPDALKERLKIRNQEDVNALTDRLSVRTLPVQQSEKTWQDAWEEFKASIAR